MIRDRTSKIFDFDHYLGVSQITLADPQLWLNKKLSEDAQDILWVLDFSDKSEQPH
jgi:hypothetical protein